MEMVRRALLAGGIIIWCCLSAGCGRKNRPVSECPFLIGGDSVSISMVERLVPDSLPRPKKIGRAALELACARQCADSGLAKRIGSDLANQLSRLSQETWSPEAGRTLFAASRTIALRARESSSLKGACDYADSLFSAAVSIRDSGSFREIRKKPITVFDAAPPWHGDPAALERLIGILFDLPPEASRIVCEFAATEETASPRSADIGAAVKGLVRDSACARLKKPRPSAASPAVALQDNSKEALALRGRGSIKDSIDKKFLKIHETMRGTVWVTFRIDPSGKVESARIKTSSITEKDFLNPFHEYVAQKIHFLGIPKQAGMMSVEFPFEFTPEN
jgi:TonB family protein